MQGRSLLPAPDGISLMFFRPWARRPLAALPVILALVSPELALAQAVQISGAWARATAPQQQEGAVYMSLTSPAGDRLTAVACPEAAGAMLHETMEHGGMSSMQDMDGIDLPPGQTVRLAPRGMHIMLVGLKQKLKPGDRIDVELTFSKAGHETVRVPVQPIGAAGPPG